MRVVQYCQWLFMKGIGFLSVLGLIGMSSNIMTVPSPGVPSSPTVLIYGHTRSHRTSYRVSRGQLDGMGHQDCVQLETPKVTSYGIPWAHVECGTLCGGTEWDSHGHPMRLRTDGNPTAFMDRQWQYWTLLDFNLYNNQLQATLYFIHTHKF